MADGADGDGIVFFMSLPGRRVYGIIFAVAGRTRVVETTRAPFRSAMARHKVVARSFLFRQ